MNPGRPSRRRESLAISVAILKAARKGIKKTNLLYSVSLSYDQLSRYLGFLKANDFIEEYDRFYRATEKGLELIAEFESSPLTRSILTT